MRVEVRTLTLGLCFGKVLAGDHVGDHLVLGKNAAVWEKLDSIQEKGKRAFQKVLTSQAQGGR